MKRIVYLGSIIAGIIVIALFSSNIFSQFDQHHVEMQVSNDEAVMPDTTEEKSYMVIDRLRQEFGSEPISAGGVAIHVTFSAGIKKVLYN